MQIRKCIWNFTSMGQKEKLNTLFKKSAGKKITGISDIYELGIGCYNTNEHRIYYFDCQNEENNRSFIVSIVTGLSSSYKDLTLPNLLV